MNQNGDELDGADMAALAAGREAALNNLMERHSEKLFHYLIRLLQNETDAADLAQETFVKVYQNRGKFRGDSKFSTWLYAIATNLARSSFRWKNRHPEVSLEAGNQQTERSLEDSMAAADTSPLETLQAEERTNEIRQAVAALPEDLRVPLVLVEYEDKSQTEIATILNCSVKTVEMRIYRARQQLRKRFNALVEDF
ncbi:MAG: sigma-70 family RNA polymerase sigma factor [Verrucomicrobiota bacterium]